MFDLRINMKKRSIRLKKSAAMVYKKLFIAFVVLVIFFAFFIPFTGANRSTMTKTVPYVVHDGDTVWALAEAICPDNMRLPQVVFEICQINGLQKGGLIYTGQTIELPVY